MKLIMNPIAFKSLKRALEFRPSDLQKDWYAKWTGLEERLLKQMETHKKLMRTEPLPWRIPVRPDPNVKPGLIFIDEEIKMQDKDVTPAVKLIKLFDSKEREYILIDPYLIAIARPAKGGGTELLLDMNSPEHLKLTVREDLDTIQELCAG